VLFGFMAAVTAGWRSHLDILLPQRQTVLVDQASRHA
jgi:hypothetical protein